jgi:hypothetical protein
VNIIDAVGLGLLIGFIGSLAVAARNHTRTHTSDYNQARLRTLLLIAELDIEPGYPWGPVYGETVKLGTIPLPPGSTVVSTDAAGRYGLHVYPDGTDRQPQHAGESYQTAASRGNSITWRIQHPNHTTVVIDGKPRDVSFGPEQP